MTKLRGERRAVAAIGLSLFAFYFLLIGIILHFQGSELAPMLFGFAGVYGLATFSIIAGYFWARWYGMGVAVSGLLVAAINIMQIGPELILFIWGGVHLAVLLSLLGRAMSEFFDGRQDWRNRFSLTDDGVQRLGKAVTRASVSIPFLVAAALAPKDGVEMLLGGLLLGGVALSFSGMLRNRTVGLLALPAFAVPLVFVSGTGYVYPQILGGMIACACLLPFAGPLGNWITGKNAIR